MDLEEVKVCLRALLSSTPTSYDLNSLLCDFKRTTGFNLPLFGHLHPVEFLRSLNDTVQLFGDLYNPEIALVRSKKSAHIISLVDRQKTKTKNPYCMSKQRRHVVPAKNIEISFSSKGNNYTCPDFPFFTKKVKDEEKQISLTSRKTSQEILHNSIQKSETKSNFPFLEADIWAKASSKPKSTELPLEVQTDIIVPKTINTSVNIKISSTQLLSKPEVEKTPFGSVESMKADSYYFEDVSESNSYLSNDDLRSSSGQAVSTSCCVVNSGIKNKLKKLIKNYPSGLWCCELPDLFFEEYNFILDYREFGYTSLIQMLSELPDIFRCVRPGNEDWILFDASVTQALDEKKIIDLQLKEKIRTEVKTNIQKLLTKCFNDPLVTTIELDKIPDLYKETFGTPLDLKSLGFSDVKSLIESLEESFLNIFSLKEKQLCNFANDRTIQSSARWKEALPPITAESDIFLEIFPKEVVGPEGRFLELDLTRHIAIGHVVEVCIAEVWSPNKFFLQLNKYKTKLNRFMDDLQRFYDTHLNKYKMPDSTIQAKQICVGSYNSDPEFPEEWHRAEIVKVINEKTVLINFVDYGTVTRVKKTQLRFMHRNFLSFPIQAFRAQLSGVVPPNDDEIWPMSTSEKFLKLLKVPYLNAEMVDIDFKIPSLSVILSDPYQKPKVSINEILVLKKLARFKEPFHLEEEMPERNSQKCKQANDKTESLAVEPSTPSKVKDDVFKKPENTNLTFEFEEIPDLKKNVEEEKVEVETEKVKTQDSVSDAKKSSLKSSSITPEDKLKTCPQRTAEEESQTKVCQSISVFPEQKSPEKFQRLPPGLEHVNVPDFNGIQFFQQSDNLKKKINFLALELLLKNASIRQVGLNDPVLALNIATEMAEVFISSEISRNSSCGNFYSLIPEIYLTQNGGVPPMPVPALNHLVKEPSASIIPSNLISQEPFVPVETANKSRTSELNVHSTPQGPAAKANPANQYVEEISVGGKTVHLIKLDNELYFCAEEIVRQFTLISNREIADRLLQIKKITTPYRVISKKSDEKVLHALKSCNLSVIKRKSKKLKIYLLQLSKVVPFLQALGYQTKTFENDILEMKKKWEEKVQEAEHS